MTSASAGLPRAARPMQGAVLWPPGSMMMFSLGIYGSWAISSPA